MSKHQDKLPPVTLFGSNYEKSGKLYNKEFEQGSIGDNYFLTVVAALGERDGILTNLFH